jgi:hypothetical protein
MIKKLLSILPDKSDVFLYAGLALIFFGTYQVYPPASFITIGILFLAIALIQAKGGK